MVSSWVAKIFEHNNFGVWFLSLGIILQIVSFIITGNSLISLISGLTGIIAVVWCAERRMSFWIFAWIQLITYCILAWQQNFYGELLINLFYTITMIYGMFIWNKSRDEENISKVKSNQLSDIRFQGAIGCCTIGTLILYSILLRTNDTQPFMDSITTVPAFFAQILMILAYREQWYFWIIIDIFSIIMWFIAGDWNMTLQYIFWTVNCLYGLSKWK